MLAVLAETAYLELSVLVVDTAAAAVAAMTASNYTAAEAAGIAEKKADLLLAVLKHKTVACDRQLPLLKVISIEVCMCNDR